MPFDNTPLPGYTYWDSFPGYPVSDWIYEVSNHNTRHGYWQWVKNMREARGEDKSGPTPQELIETLKEVVKAHKHEELF